MVVWKCHSDICYAHCLLDRKRVCVCVCVCVCVRKQNSYFSMCFYFQEALQKLLVVIAGLCVPWMLLLKPILLRQAHLGKIKIPVWYYNINNTECHFEPICHLAPSPHLLIHTVCTCLKYPDLLTVLKDRFTSVRYVGLFLWCTFYTIISTFTRALCLQASRLWV